MREERPSIDLEPNEPNDRDTFVDGSKLRPPQLLATWLDRPKVARKFSSATSVLAIVAGPGYGKTVAAAYRYVAWRGPKVWYTLDGRDGDLAVFATYVAAMLRALGREVPVEGDAWKLGTPARVGRVFAEALADAPPSPLLVFDDVHVLEGTGARIALAEFVERATRLGATFVLCGRAMPIALHAVATSARLASAGVAELAFDESESRAFLRATAARGIDADTLERFAVRAKGWPAGLAIVASMASIRERSESESVRADDDESTRRLVHVLRIEMFGGFRVFVRDEVVPGAAWKRRKARDIFAYLASVRGRVVARARLVDLYWPEADADAAHDNLRVTISAIRKAVGDVVKFEADGYRFVAPPDTSIDTERFDDAIETARRAVAREDAERSRRGYRAAIECYRGEFLDGMADGGWQWRERERLRADFLEALRYVAADRAAETTFRLAMLDRLLDVAPFDLEAIRMRLDLMVVARRTAEARRDYEAWKARYRDAVGTDAPEVWHAPHDDIARACRSN